MKPSPIIATLISRIGRLLAGKRQIAGKVIPSPHGSYIDRQVAGPRTPARERPSTSMEPNIAAPTAHSKGRVAPRHRVVSSR